VKTTFTLSQYNLTPDDQALWNDWIKRIQKIEKGAIFVKP